MSTHGYESKRLNLPFVGILGAPYDFDTRHRAVQG